MQHSNHSTPSSNSSLFRHLILLVIGVVSLAGLYAYLRDLELVVAAGMALVLVYLVAAGVVEQLRCKLTRERDRRWRNQAHDDDRPHSEFW